MIRIYLDWSIVSVLKREDNQKLRKFIDEHKDCLQFLYSPAHFQDLMKSHSSDNKKKFYEDLNTLEYLCESHLIRWENNRTTPLIATPKEYFEGVKNQEDIFALMDMDNIVSTIDEVGKDMGMGGMGTLMKMLLKSTPIGFEINDENRDILHKMFPNLTSDSNTWDLVRAIAPSSKKLLSDREYYKSLRNTLGEKGFKLDPSSGNWSEEEVIDNINNFLKSFGAEMTYFKYIEESFKHRKEPANLFDFFTTAYLMLDLIGYRADKLPKPTNTMQNIQADAEHAFYGAHCDYFVVVDKILSIKSRILYREFGVPTQVIHPNELITVLEKVMHNYTATKDNFISEALKFVDFEKVVEHHPISKDNAIETFAIKLPYFYFNFFNYIVYSNFMSHGGIVLTFKKAFKNYSDFVYYTEAEKVIDRVTAFFGFDDQEELQRRKQELVYGKDFNAKFLWDFQGGKIILEKDTDTQRPILSYVISTKFED
jgi:hypothetical protein